MVNKTIGLSRFLSSHRRCTLNGDEGEWEEALLAPPSVISTSSDASNPQDFLTEYDNRDDQRKQGLPRLSPEADVSVTSMSAQPQPSRSNRSPRRKLFGPVSLRSVTSEKRSKKEVREPLKSRRNRSGRTPKICTESPAPKQPAEKEQASSKGRVRRRRSRRRSLMAFISSINAEEQYPTAAGDISIASSSAQDDSEVDEDAELASVLSPFSNGNTMASILSSFTNHDVSTMVASNRSVSKSSSKPKKRVDPDTSTTKKSSAGSATNSRRSGKKEYSASMQPERKSDQRTAKSVSFSPDAKEESGKNGSRDRNGTKAEKNKLPSGAMVQQEIVVWDHVEPSPVKPRQLHGYPHRPDRWWYEAQTPEFSTPTKKKASRTADIHWTSKLKSNLRQQTPQDNSSSSIPRLRRQQVELSMNQKALRLMSEVEANNEQLEKEMAMLDMEVDDLISVVSLQNNNW